jgi:hypothetical protein
MAAALLYLLAAALLVSTYVAARGGLRSDDASALLSMKPKVQHARTSRSGLFRAPERTED